MQRTHTSWTDVRPRKVVVSSGTAYFGPHHCRAEFEDAKLHTSDGSFGGHYAALPFNSRPSGKYAGPLFLFAIENAEHF